MFYFYIYKEYNYRYNISMKEGNIMKNVFINARLWDGHHTEEIKENMSVFIENGIIEKIQEGYKDIPDEYKIIDLNGKYLLPGFINLHAHLFGSGKPSKALGGGLSQKILVNFVNTPLGKPVIDKMVLDHVQNSLYAGVTTIRSSGDFAYSDVRIRDRINQGEVIGPRLIVPGPAITCVGGHGDGTFAIASNDLLELAEFVEEHSRHNVDYIKICVTGGVMDATVKGEPGVVKMTLEQTKKVCQRAHEHGYRVASHTESSQGIKIALEGGVDTIEHGSFLNDELVKLFKERKSAFIVTTSPALPLAKLSPHITKLNDLCVYNSEVVLKGMIDGAKKALANNIPVGLGTDESCPLVTSYGMWREIYYFAKYYGVTNAFALHTATLVNAQILGISEMTGSIEKGKQADMIVVKENPLKNLMALKNIEIVVARGQIIEKPIVKKLPQVDEWLDTLL